MPEGSRRSSGNPTKNQRGSELMKAKRRGDTEFLRDALVDAEIRTMAVKYLGDIGATEAIPQILRLVSAGDPITRSSSIRALTKLDAEEAVDELERVIAADESNTVRAHAVSAISRLGKPERVLPVLFRALEDPDGSVSACAAHHIGRFGDASAIPALLKAKESHSIVRGGAYRKAIRRIRRRRDGGLRPA
jgi:HEAT repeat protein